ncbi:MAG: tRNA glutamyl-Q(34) synthetase GluQRS [Acidobacteriota bacterium]
MTSSNSLDPSSAADPREPSWPEILAAGDRLRDADGGRGRWAPTPSGWIHLGNARTALAAWLMTRAAGGSFLFRLEDLDRPRTVTEAVPAAQDDLRWLGLDWDEGPDTGGPSLPYEQSRRTAVYRAALDHLAAVERLFPCRRSRRELRDLARAPHGAYTADHVPAYPRRWRPREVAPDWYRAALAAADAALRFRVADGATTFVDGLFGPQRQEVTREVGDFVLRRRDGLIAYQLAVVVDDLAMGVGQVVRGTDLLDSTARQLQLIEALGGRPPAHLHVPMLLDADGEKLSKRHSALEIRALRSRGVASSAVIGLLAWTLGLIETARPVAPSALVEDFAPDRLRRDDVRLTAPMLQHLDP